MTGSDYLQWEERYSQSGRIRKIPDAFLLGNVSRLTPGLVLDVAMGEGRNSLFLARHGFSVVGVERSPAAVQRAREWARQENLDIDMRVWDLESRLLPHTGYNSIVVTRYLQRSLFEVLYKSLLPGGTLLYETYTVEYLKYGPRNRAHLLNHNELLQAFSGLQVLHYAEVDKPQTREYCAQLLARKPSD